MSELLKNITIIENVPKEDLERMLPSFRYEWLNLLGFSLQKILCFAIKDDEDKIIAICVYVTRSNISNNTTLLYSQVIEKHRNCGIATKLFTASLEQLKKWGYHSVEAFALQEKDHNLLKKWGLELKNHENYMKYSSDPLLSSKIVKSLDKLSPIKKYIKRYNELPQKEITDFCKIQLNQGESNEIESYNNDLTRFYLGGNKKIVGFLPLKIADDGNTYTNTDLYIQKNENANIALPAMLADLLHSLKNTINQDTRFVLRVVSKTNYNTMIQGFGKPDEEVITELYSYDLSK